MPFLFSFFTYMNNARHFLTSSALLAIDAILTLIRICCPFCHPKKQLSSQRAEQFYACFIPVFLFFFSFFPRLAMAWRFRDRW